MADFAKSATRQLVTLATLVLPERAGKAVSHRLRARDEQRRAHRANAIVLSHAKSGRTWLRVMISRLFQTRYGLPEREILEFDNWHRIVSAVPTILFTHGHYLGALFDAPGPKPILDERKLVFLARHPCDIAVSQYFHTAKRAKEYKKKLHGVADEDIENMFGFVMQSAQGLPEIVSYLNSWARRLEHRPEALIVAYEPLRARPDEELSRVCEYLGFNFSAEEIAESVAFGAFDNMKELERTRFFRSNRLAPKDPNDADSYKVRRAKVGGYRDYFEEDEVAAMEDYVRKELSPLFGYASGGSG
jgi:hypothetical protein